MAFSPDGKYMALGSIVGVIYIWDLKQHHVITEAIGERGLVTSVAFSPDGKTLASRILVPSVDPLPREKILLWDMDTLQTIGQPLTGLAATGGDSGLISMAFSPDGSTLASGTDDGAIILWDLTLSQ
jgi:WD40 repeat protein